MKIVDIAVSELKPFDGNVRKHSEKQVKEMIRALEQFGQTRAIVCDENGMVLVGNCLLEAVRRMGWDKVQCYVIKGFSEAKKKKLVLSDNQIYKLGADDFDAIRNLVADISIDDDLDIAGYDIDVLEAMNLDADELEEQLQDYGTITDPKYTEYVPEKAPEARPVASEHESVQEQPYEHGSAESYEPQAQSQPANQRRTVICPSCGEVIYLD